MSMNRAVIVTYPDEDAMRKLRPGQGRRLRARRLPHPGLPILAQSWGGGGQGAGTCRPRKGEECGRAPLRHEPPGHPGIQPREALPRGGEGQGEDILEIFKQRASTSEAKLQVQLAELSTELPRARDKVRMARKGEQPGFFGLGKYKIDVYTR